MDEKKQIEEMANDIDKSHWRIEQDFTGCHINSDKIAEYLIKQGWRKQSEGEWVVEAKHFFDDYGDLILYAIAHCSECKTPYRNNHDVDYERIERPENLDYYADWEIDVEPLKQKFLEQAKRVKLHKYCHECGAKMKGGAE